MMNSKNKSKRILIGILTVCSVLLVSACGVDDQETIDKKYSVEAVNITKVTKLPDVTFYVPDSYTEHADPVYKSSSYVIEDEKFIINVQPIKTMSSDINELSNIVSDIFDYDIQITNSVSDNKWECIVNRKDNALSGYIRCCNGYIILAAGNTDTANEIVDSLKPNETYNGHSDGVVEVIRINDSSLSANMNGVEVGQVVSLAQVQSDYSQMAENYERMKNELSGVNGDTIQNIKSNVYIQFTNISNSSEDAQEAYVQSMGAYADMIDEYNIELSNGLDLSSHKKDIEKAFGLDLSSEWEQIVIENENPASAIRSVTINYDDVMDKISSLEVEGDEKSSFTAVQENVTDESIENNNTLGLVGRE